jgi:hypothetical protein
MNVGELLANTPPFRRAHITQIIRLDRVKQVQVYSIVDVPRFK